MPSTPSSRLLLEIQQQGENLNTWGDDRLNKLLKMLESSGHGSATHTLTADLSLTYTNFTDTNGTKYVQIISAASDGEYTLTLGARERAHLIINKSAYAQTIACSGGGTSVTIPANQSLVVFCDATNVERQTDGADRAYVQGELANYLPLAGGSLTDFLTLHANPTADTHAATKAYVDGIALGSISVSMDFDDLNNKPTTVAGYGITDGLTTSIADEWRLRP